MRHFPWFLLFLPLAARAADTDGDGLEDADEILAHLPVLVPDSDADGLYDHLDSDMDGDGIPNDEECRLGGVSGLALVNGGFELPDYSGSGVYYPASMPGWQTTDAAFEVWLNGFEGKSAYEGDQFVEMNAFAVGTLYQDVLTTPGDVYIYAFSHRGRFGSDTINFNFGMTTAPDTVRTVTDGPGAWGRYGGVITITETVSRFAYQSVASACGLSCGNLLDDISFVPACDLDTDGDGSPDALDTDSDGDGVFDSADICPGEDDAVADPDGDLECSSTDPCPLDPYDDLDGDGVCGDVDLCAGFDDAVDMDADSLPDGCDTDRDGDGWHEWDDCNEDDPSVGAAETYYPDFDGDGYGNSSVPFVTCAPGVMFVLLGGDCDNSDPNVHPGIVETCFDAWDFNCDGVVSYNDMDFDAVCDDVDACLGSDDALDMDGDLTPDGCDADVDGDGVDGSLDCNDADAAVLGPNSWYLDFDGDGYGDAADSVESCSPVAGRVMNEADCEDASAAAHPGGTEVIDSIDNDCNGLVDDGTDAFDDDGDGLSELAGDCDDGDVSIGAPMTAYEDRDADGYGKDSTAALYCSLDAMHVLAAGDCDDTDSDVNPAAVEDCAVPGEDLNCDGSVGYADNDGDRLPACEDCDDTNPALDNQTIWYLDADGDGYGNVSDNFTGCLGAPGYVLIAGDCDDSDPLRWSECVDTVVEVDTAYVYIHDTVVVTETVVERDTVIVYIDDNEYLGGWRCGFDGPQTLDLILLGCGAVALRRRRAA
jgi:hypothetical protein